MIDACIQLGMSRSGSTITWQMLGDLLDIQVCKSHTYDGGKSPHVVTIRHPLDAASSYWRACGRKQSINPLHPIEQTIYHVIKAIDEHEGPLLIIKYEDWWPDTGNLLTKLATFAGVSLSSERYGQIIARRSLATNKAIADRIGEWSKWDDSTMIHGNHIGTGKPGSRSELPAHILLEGARMFSAFMQRFGYTI